MKELRELGRTIGLVNPTDEMNDREFEYLRKWARSEEFKLGYDENTIVAKLIVKLIHSYTREGFEPAPAELQRAYRKVKALEEENKFLNQKIEGLIIQRNHWIERFDQLSSDKL